MTFWRIIKVTFRSCFFSVSHYRYIYTQVSEVIICRYISKIEKERNGIAYTVLLKFYSFLTIVLDTIFYFRVPHSYFVNPFESTFDLIGCLIIKHSFLELNVYPHCMIGWLSFLITFWAGGLLFWHVDQNVLRSLWGRSMIAISDGYSLHFVWEFVLETKNFENFPPYIIHYQTYCKLRNGSRWWRQSSKLPGTAILSSWFKRCSA